MPAYAQARLAGQADVRLGPRPAPPDLRRLRGRALTPAERDSLIERLTDYYLSNRKHAFTDKPKIDGADGRAVFQPDIPEGLPQVQRADLGLSLAPGGPVRAADRRADTEPSARPAYRRPWRASGPCWKTRPAGIPELMPMTAGGRAQVQRGSIRARP